LAQGRKEEEQTTRWPKEKVQTDKQRSTKYAHKNKHRVTRAPLRCLLHLFSYFHFLCLRRYTNIKRHHVLGHV